MAHIPVLTESAGDGGFAPQPGKPIIQLKDLEPDWERYNEWRASLVESYSGWRKRWRQFHLDQQGRCD